MRYNVIWFSRHAATEDQLVEIEVLTGIDRPDIINLSELAARNITTEEEKHAVFRELRKACDPVAEVFGVIPTVIREQLAVEDSVSHIKTAPVAVAIYESWNIQRSVEGGKPTFEHKRWCCTGEYTI